MSSNRQLSSKLGRQAEIERRSLSYADVGELLGSDEERVKWLFSCPGWGIDPACELAAALGIPLSLEIGAADQRPQADLSYAVPLTAAAQPRSRPSALAGRSTSQMPASEAVAALAT